MARIRHLAILTEDVERLVKFYTNSFGLKIVKGVGTATYLTDGHLNLAIIPIGPEREIDERFDRWTAIRDEAAGVKFVRLGPVSLAPMEVEDGHDDIHPHRNAITLQFIFLRATATNRPDGGIDPEGFLNHLPGILERA